MYETFKILYNRKKNKVYYINLLNRIGYIGIYNMKTLVSETKNTSNDIITSKGSNISNCLKNAILDKMKKYHYLLTVFFRKKKTSKILYSD